MEVFKISQGRSIIGFEDLFVLDKNNKGIRGHNLKLSKARCTRDCWKHFFSNRVVNRWNKLVENAGVDKSARRSRGGHRESGQRSTKKQGWTTQEWKVVK